MNLRILLSKFCYGIILLVFYGSAIAQDRVITGLVTDSKDKQPLIGVSVAVRGTTTGTTTGADGSFRLTVPATATTLTFTYLGYNTQNATISDRTTINI